MSARDVPVVHAVSENVGGRTGSETPQKNKIAGGTVLRTVFDNIDGGTESIIRGETPQKNRLGGGAVLRTFSDEMDSGTELTSDSETPRQRRCGGEDDPVNSFSFLVSAILIKRRLRPTSGLSERLTSQWTYEMN
jgi:hypothetical protein